MRAALIRDSLVENVIVVGEDYEPPDGLDLVELADGEPIGPGFLRVGGGWQAPPAPTPTAAPSVLDLAAQLIRVQQVLDALVVADLAPATGDLDGLLDDLGGLADSGGSLDDLLGLDLDGLADEGGSLDDLDDLDALLTIGA